MIPQELTVKITLSPLQWGEQPGSLRFSIHTTSEKIAIGSFSVGGMSAYQLREKIASETFLNARVICGGPRKFVLTHLMGEDGWVSWKDAVASAPWHAVDVLVDKISLPQERRAVPAASHEVKV